MGYISEHIKSIKTSTLDNEIVCIFCKNVKHDCIELIENGYKNYLSDTDKIFSSDETTITAGIYNHICKIIDDVDLPIHVVPELHQYTAAIKKGEVNPNKAKRFDLYFIDLQYNPRVKFGVEAKLLAEQTTSTKSATTLINEYVENAGMGKFINKIYEDEGFMLGYILNGTPDKIVGKINLKITAVYTAKEQLVVYKKHYISSYSFEDIRKELHHVFLDFSSLSNYHS
jgi:hypothetical protein